MQHPTILATSPLNVTLTANEAELKTILTALGLHKLMTNEKSEERENIKRIAEQCMAGLELMGGL